jgi:hypothetical protein
LSGILRHDRSQQLIHLTRAPFSQQRRWLVNVCENYAKSLEFGTKYTYQTLPRLLTLWLDIASKVKDNPDK